MSRHLSDTTETYDAIASSYLENTRDRGLDFEWLRSFSEGLPSGARVLDLGSGPGRDSATLRELGLHAICLDRSIGMLKAGVDDYPAPRVLADMLAIPLGEASVAGVWANASLLHLAPEELDRAMEEIRRVLSPGGMLHVSLKQGDGSSWESKRYGKRRWFQYWSGAELDRVLERFDLKIVRSAEERASQNTWLVRQCICGD